MGEPADATVLEKRKPADPAAITSPGSGPPSDTHALTRPATHATTVETLRAEEVMRTRTFLIVIMILAGVTPPLCLIMGGDPVAQALFLTSCGLMLILAAIYWVLMRDPAWFDPIKALPPAAVGVVTATAACHYFGVFSPAPMMFTLGIYFFSLGSSRAAATAVYVACAIAVAGGMGGVSIGLLPDAGLVPSAAITPVQKIVMGIIVELVLGLTFLFARMSRHATRVAIEGLEGALRQVGQREALLQEAHHELDRALRGGQGRWSGEKLGAWRLSHLIGRGAMGEVYEAHHETHETAGAVKLLLPDAQRDATQLRRFLREAQVMSQLESPHVVKVYEVGEGAAGVPYIVMELLRGHDLAWHLRKRRRLPPARVAEMVVQVARVLEEARANDIVHRDLKPQNLFWTEIDGDAHAWKVLDFGVSKLGVDAGTLTRGHVIGTPGYMAPEQARGLAVDHRADIFSLTAISYRAFTGRPAFSGEEYPKIMFDIVYRQPTRPGDHAPLPPDVDLALAIGLAKKPDDRFATAAELARALDSALSDRLPESLRHHARRLIAIHPWGEAIR